jgi:hypothetical protein
MKTHKQVLLDFKRVLPSEQLHSSREFMERMYGGVESLPTTFLIDREGRIAAEHVGLAGKSTYEGQILKLLNSAKQADAP